MFENRHLSAYVVLTLAASAMCCSPAFGANALSIYDIQYTTAANGASPEDSHFVNCLGGIVIGKIDRSKPSQPTRILIYDPDHPDAWGAIQVKDWSTDDGLFNAVSLGYWVSFTDIYVEDNRGTTFLQYSGTQSPSAAYEIETDAYDDPVLYSLPAPLVVSASELAAPVEDPADYWLVADRNAEKYESMLVTIQDISVTDMGLGKAKDNYNLQTPGGSNVWAADFYNVNRDDVYDPKVSMGQHFDSVTGMLEHYYSIGAENAWDYYQIMTRSTEDLVIPEPASMFLLTCGAAWLVSRRRP